MSVAMVASVFHPSLGGIQTHTLRLSQKLRARNIDVTVLTRASPDWPSRHELEGVPVVRLGLRRAPAAAASLAFIGACVVHVVRARKRFSLLHAQQMLSPMSIGIATRQLAGLPLVVNPHLSGPEGDVQLLQKRAWLGRARLAAAWRCADAFVCISDAISQELRSAGAPAQRLADIGNGIDLERHPLPSRDLRQKAKARLGGPIDAPWVVFTGRLAHQKGLDVLLAAWRHVSLAAPAAKLVLVGEGEEDAALKARAHDLGLQDSVVFAGRADDVRPYLAAADVYVLPSRAEGLSVALLEAMASGLPVVATAVGGTPQVIRDGDNGALVRAEDAEALASRLLEALSPMSAQWGERARATIREHYSLDTVAERTVLLYRALLSDASA